MENGRTVEVRLFVGGPLDGRKIVLDRGTADYRYDGGSRPTAYAPRKIGAATIMAPIGWTGAMIAKKLTEGYSNAKATEDRIVAAADRERALRRLLWLAHGCIAVGEKRDRDCLACPSCGINFAHDSVESIERTIRTGLAARLRK